MKIVLIEDEPDTLNLYHEFLKTLGFSDVELIESPKRFKVKNNIKKLVSDYDLVICDVNLPEINGHEILKEFVSYRNESQMKPLFIVVTGIPASYLNQDGEGWGSLILADEILGKPVDLEDFRSALTRLGLLK